MQYYLINGIYVGGKQIYRLQTSPYMIFINNDTILLENNADKKNNSSNSFIYRISYNGFGI